MDKDEAQNETLASARAGASQTDQNTELRDLLLFRSGGRALAVFADEVDATAEGKKPAGLPRAPQAVLGVVCVRGRMLTVLDPMALLTGEGLSWPDTLPYVIAVRGDQQLALAAQDCGDTITVATEDIQEFESEPNSTSYAENSNQAVLGAIEYGGEKIIVLDTSNLLAPVLRQKERRRRRF